MIQKDYTMAGYVSIVNAVLTLPLAFISLFIVIDSGNGFSLAQSLLQVVQIGFFVYMFLSFKDLINKNFNFKEVNNLIDVLIVGNVLLILLNFFSPLIGGIIALLAMVVLGIIQVVIFIKLLGLGSDLYGYLKPLAYTSIATGVLIASILLMGFAFIPSIISDVILGMIFFKASKQKS